MTGFDVQTTQRVLPPPSHANSNVRKIEKKYQNSSKTPHTQAPSKEQQEKTTTTLRAAQKNEKNISILSVWEMRSLMEQTITIIIYWISHQVFPSVERALIQILSIVWSQKVFQFKIDNFIAFIKVHKFASKKICWCTQPASQPTSQASNHRTSKQSSWIPHPLCHARSNVDGEARKRAPTAVLCSNSILSQCV